MPRRARVAALLVAGVLAALEARPARATDPDPTESPAERELRAESAPPPDARLAPREPGGGGPPVDLFPTDTLGALAGWQLRPEPAPSTLEEQSEEGLDRWMDGVLRDDAVSAGAVDGWYHGLGQAMRRAFRPDLGAMTRERRAGMDGLEVAADELGRYAQRPQRPMDPAGVAPSTLFARSREDEAVQDVFDQRSPLHAPITWHRMELRVTHAPDGTVLAVHVTRPSGMPSMDRAAVEALRAAAPTVAPPPPRVRGDRPSFVSEWAFEVGDVATQWGVLGSVDDPATGEQQAAALGRGGRRTSVSLLRVIDAQHPSFEERQMERRHERRERERLRRR